MVLVTKRCDNCEKINEKVWIPKDMINVSFQCPICKEGAVTYKPSEKELFILERKELEEFKTLDDEMIWKLADNIIKLREKIEILEKDRDFWKKECIEVKSLSGRTTEGELVFCVCGDIMERKEIGEDGKIPVCEECQK